VAARRAESPDKTLYAHITVRESVKHSLDEAAGSWDLSLTGRGQVAVGHDQHRKDRSATTADRRRAALWILLGPYRDHVLCPAPTEVARDAK
jgi:hypothetical protein